MPEARSTPWPSLSAIWGLLWRAALLAPLACVAATLFLGAFLAVPLLLFGAYIYAAVELWWQSAAYLGAALALVAVLRVIVPRVFGASSDFPGGNNA